MAYVSLVEVFGEAKANFEESYPYSEDNEKTALVLATIAFFVGWFLGIGMDFVLHKFVPTSSEESLKTDPEGKWKIKPKFLLFLTISVRFKLIELQKKRIMKITLIPELTIREKNRSVH